MIKVRKLRSPNRKVEVFLRKDIVRNVPLLYDLTSGFNYCDWFVAYLDIEVKGTLTLFKETSILTRGSPKAVKELLGQVDDKETFFIIPMEHEKLVKERYNLFDTGEYVLMYVTEQNFKPRYIRRTEKLNNNHLDEVGSFLEKHGVDAWSPEQLSLGPFFCIRKDQTIVSVAGKLTVYEKTPGAALIGNVYTAKAYRRRGYASAVSSSVTSELLEHLKYVTLWVRKENAPAINLYEKLGYRRKETFLTAKGVPKS